MQTWLNCYKFISAKNIIILFVSHEFTRLIWGWKTANMDYSLSISLSLYIYIYTLKIYINLNSLARVK